LLTTRKAVKERGKNGTTKQERTDITPPPIYLSLFHTMSHFGVYYKLHTNEETERVIHVIFEDGIEQERLVKDDFKLLQPMMQEWLNENYGKETIARISDTDESVPGPLDTRTSYWRAS